MPSKKEWRAHVDRCHKATKAELLEGLFNVSRDRRAARLRLRRERAAHQHTRAQLASLNDSLEDAIQERAADRLDALRDAVAELLEMLPGMHEYDRQKFLRAGRE